VAEDSCVEDAARVLFAAPPDDFLAKRAELAKHARDAGDGAAAAEIAKMRKPTLAAWVVNAHVLADDTVRSRIDDIGEQLRTAQGALDAKVLRELSPQRRALVGGLTDAALDRAGRHDAATTLRDDVRATFDAAVADPEVAGRLGRLHRPESFSGFGFGDAMPPQLTLVQGGRRDPAPTAAKTTAKRSGSRPASDSDAATEPDAPRRSAADRKADREAERALEAARVDVDDAESRVVDSRKGETAAAEAVKQAERDLTAARDALAAAKSQRDQAREAHREAVAHRRDARRALDRLQKSH
jgi:hypothetical protein